MAFLYLWTSGKGGIVGVVDVTDCVEKHKSKWTFWLGIGASPSSEVSSVQRRFRAVPARILKVSVNSGDRISWFCRSRARLLPRGERRFYRIAGSSDNSNA